MLTKTERNERIAELEDAFKNASGIYLTENNKINVGKVTKLRAEFRQNGARYVVVKNSLARIAFERCGIDGMAEHLKGPVGVVITNEDATVPARILKDFHKENKELCTIKISLVDGTLFDADQTQKLADIPSREVLLSQLLSCMKAPMTNLAGSLNGILSKFVGTLEAVKNKKEAGE